MSYGNDINQVNESGAGFATGATAPELIRGLKPKKQGLGLDGPNRTRFTPLGVIVNSLFSKVALPDNKWRNYLMIQNKSSSNILVGFGVNLDVNGDNGFIIASGGFYEIDNRTPFNSIFVRGTALANQQVLVIEGTIDKAGK